jgi:hypothetical protein
MGMCHGSKGPVPRARSLLLVCAAIASCTAPKHVVETPSLHGPFMSGAAWWIPTNPWSSGLSCGSDLDPMPNVDIDADGRADGFALGAATTDDRGTTAQMVCIAREAHLIVDGKSVGKCPWLGGRNYVQTYYVDEDCNGDIDDDDDDQRPDQLGPTVMVSLDGPLPPITNVSFGEWVVSDDELVAITADNYAELTDARGNSIDNDRDGLVDVTAYYHRDGEVTKRHYEIDPRTGVITEDEAGQVRFEPTDPGSVPDDLGLRVPYAPAIAAMEAMAAPDVASARVSSADAAIVNVSIGTDWLPVGLVVRTTEALQGSHTLAAEVTHGLPLEVVPVQDGFVFHFVPLRSSGSIVLRIAATTRLERGWAGLPTVSIDGKHLPHASREREGTVIVEAGFSATHSTAVEVRFPSAP